MRIIAKGEGKGETMGVVGSNEKKSTSKKEKEKKTGFWQTNICIQREIRRDKRNPEGSNMGWYNDSSRIIAPRNEKKKENTTATAKNRVKSILCQLCGFIEWRNTDTWISSWSQRVRLDSQLRQLEQQQRAGLQPLLVTKLRTPFCRLIPVPSDCR